MKQKKNISRIILIIIISLVILNGCWDRRELDNLAIVQALGFDLAPDQRHVMISVMIAIPSQISGGQSGGGNGPNVLVVTKEAPSIYEAFNVINTSLNREITLLQNQVIIFGEKLAKQGVQDWVDHLLRYREMRRTLLIFVSKDPILEIMTINPKLEKSPAEYFTDLARLSEKNGMSPEIILNQFINSYESSVQESVAPVIGLTSATTAKSTSSDSNSGGKPEKVEKEISTVGTAVFKQDRLVGYLDNYETQTFQMITSHFKEAMLTTKDPLDKNGKISFRLSAGGPTKIRYHVQAGQEFFAVTINQEADLISIQSKIDYTKPIYEDRLGKYIAAQLKRRVEKLLNKAQNDYQADIFGFGIKVRNTMLTTTDWQKYDWPKHFPNAKIKVKVNVSIRRVGVQLRPPDPS